jgi:integrase
MKAAIYTATGPGEQKRVLEGYGLEDRVQPLEKGFPCVVDEDFRPIPWVDEYLQWVWSHSSQATCRQYAYELNLLVNFAHSLGRDLRSMEESDFALYKSYRMFGTDRRTVSARSWGRCKAVIEGLFNFLVLKGYLPALPYLRIGGKSVLGASGPSDDLQIRHLSLTEWQQFREVGLRGVHAVGKSQVRSPLRNVSAGQVAVTTGLRVGEFSGLLELEVFGNQGRQDSARVLVKAIAKRQKGRHVTLTKAVLKDLDLYRRTEREDIIRAHQPSLRRKLPELFKITKVSDGWVTGEKSGISQRTKIEDLSHADRRLLVSVDGGVIRPAAMFLSQSDGLMVSARGWHSIFRKANERVGRDGAAGPRPVKPHDLRHTFAVVFLHYKMDALKHSTSAVSSLIDAVNVHPLSALQRAMGHARVDTTMVYLRYINELENSMEDIFSSWLDSGEEIGLDIDPTEHGGSEL